MRKTFGKFLSLLLIAALLVQLLPSAVFAQEAENNEIGDVDVIGLADSDGSAPEDTLQNAKILFEEESLREENVKHFRMDDGSYIAVQYGTPVHYREDGQWLDYDNTLHEVSTFDGEGVSHYTVTNGDSTRIFAADANADILLALQKGNYSLTLTPINEPDAELPITPVPPVEMELMGNDAGVDTDLQFNQHIGMSPEPLQPVQTASILCYSGSGEGVTYSLSPGEGDSFYAQVQPDSMYSALEYAEALNGATLRYENYGNTVKESIVIPAPQESYSYSFTLETDGLTPTLQEDGSIYLIDSDGEIIYTIPAPYMFDAKKAYSYAASYSLTGSGSTYSLTVVADENWINSPERVFPVVLDPTIEEGTKEGDIVACFVRSGLPTSQDPTDKGLYAGKYDNNNQTTRSYFHLNNLPDIPGGCEINNVQLRLYYYAIKPDSSASTVDLGIYGLEEVEGITNVTNGVEWTQWIKNLTWETAVSDVVHSDILVDKLTLKWQNTDKNQYWDITTLAYQWYSDKTKNLGFVLKAVDEDHTYARATFHGPEHATNRPAIFVSYRNTIGIESYYNYQAFGHGRAGVSYISDYSMQNTLVVPLIQSSSEVMPFSLNLVYNSSYGGRYFTEESINGAEMLHTKNFNGMLLGIGWKLSAQQTVVPFSIGQDNYLIYTDGDGTEHYFMDANKDGVYEDEDGLKLEITISAGTNYTMKDRQDYKWFFANGYLTWEEDPYGNKITYKYTGNKLTSITRTNDGGTEQTLVTLSYDWVNKDKTVVQNNYPTAVEDQYGRITKIQYSTPDENIYYLRRLTFPDNKYADYIYQNQGEETTDYRLTRVYDAESQYGMEFSYSYNGDVRNLYEYVTEARVYGTKIHGYKRSPSQTVYRYYGKDQTDDQKKESDDNSPPDDQLMFCVLDRMGKTVGCYVTDSSEKHVLGESAAEFTENNGTDKQNNSITATASAGLQGVNLLENSGGESGATGWNGAISNTAPAYVYIGQKSLKVSNTELSKVLPLEAGETYTYSAYVKPLPGAEAQLHIQPTTGNRVSSTPVNYDASGVNNGWVRLNLTYTAAITGNHEIVLETTGTVYADALQFEKGYAPSAYNPVDDASFEWTTEWDEDDYSNTAWRRNGNTTIYTEPTDGTEPEVTGYFGSNVAKLQGGKDLQRIYQLVRLNVPLDSSFLFSAWAKGAADPDSVAQKTAETDPYFGIAVHLYFSDGKDEIHYKSFDPYCHDWQYVQDIITPKKDGHEGSNVIVTHATIAIAYDYNINAAYVDHVAFRLTQAQTYAYDAEGNVDTAALTGGGEAGAEYNAKGDLTQYTAPNGIVFNYTSNQQHSIIQEAGAGTVTDYEYHCTSYLPSPPYPSSSDKNDPRYIYSSSTPTTDKNHTASVTDTAGNTSEFSYEYGRLRTSTNPTDVVTTYAYDHLSGRSTSSYITGIAAIDYTYDKGQLTQLRRKTFPSIGAPQDAAVYQTYNFSYNAWGQSTAVAVGDRTLATYDYEDINDNATAANKGGGNKTKTTYGNGDSISYVYDKFDRLIKTVYNDTGEYVEYTYNSEGSLSKLVHCRSNNNVIATYEFERDDLGRLIRSRQLNGNNGTVQRTEHLYDAIGRLTTQRWTVGNKNYSESYTYNDGITGNGGLNTVTTATGDQMLFAYDPLNRLETTTVKSGNTTLYTTTYKYWAVDGDRTSNEVLSQYTELAGGDDIAGGRYVYDALGNIVKIYESHPYSPGKNRRLVTDYTYDDQSQLLTETHYSYVGTGDNNYTATTWHYTYDTAGNILSRHKTISTKDGNGQPIITSEPTEVKTYSYSTGDWKDLLTSVTVGNTTHALQYDQSGNPTTYGNGEKLYTNLTWEHGRQLASLTTGGKTSTFEYDHEGIRTRKIYNSEYHDYITQGGKVVRETVQSADWDWVLDFIYDTAGRPFALNYSYDGGSTFETYYYVLNLQGDVVALLDSNCNVVACYTYNAWGEILSATGEMAETNPLRYRGYYYDTETGFYYLQSRYYDPANCRFINADSIVSTGQGFTGTNMFAYCNNCPVSYSDHTGHISKYSSIALFHDGGEKPTSGVGSAKPFVGDDHHDSLYYNCLSYALGLESLVILEEYEVGDDIDQVALLTTDKVNSLGMSIRPIEGPDSPIFSYEYRIAVSVGPSDYHYMVQNSDASWSHKAGQLPPALVDAVNPDYASWDSYQTEALYYYGFFVRFRIVGITPNYYNGGIRYFAVSIGGQ